MSRRAANSTRHTDFPVRTNRLDYLIVVVAALPLGISMPGCHGCVVLRQEPPQELCARLESNRSPEEIRSILHKLSQPPDRKAKWEILLKGWGRGNACYDIAVLRWIDGRTGHHDAEADSDFVDVVAKRLEKAPSLLRQLFWYQRWSAGKSLEKHGFNDLTKGESAASESNGEGYVVAMHRHVFGLSWTRSERIRFLMIFAGMFDQPELILNLSMEKLDRRWTECDNWLDRNAAFLYFDDTLGIYQLDDDAARSNEPVAPERQEFSWPPYPMAGWTERRGLP